MMRKPYTPCHLYVDGIPDLRAGDYLTTDGGSAYLVQALRVDKKRPQRRHLDCVRWPIAEIPEDARRHKFYWYPRLHKRQAAPHAGVPTTDDPWRQLPPATQRR
jgi:hypothetical protein